MSSDSTGSENADIEQTRAIPSRDTGSQVSHYRLLERIGAGGMGEVYLAEDLKLNRRVAIKFLPPTLTGDPEMKERFRREAAAAAALNHPNIVTIHEFGEHAGRAFIVMELVEGASLGDLLREHPEGLPAERTVDLAIQIAEGLVAAHAAGVVHRDIKPSNILIDRYGRVKILDFGLAKLGQVSELTQAGRTLGTPLYMSPEQTRGDDVDQRSDIFSFGLVLYEMIAGQHPFRRDDEASTLYSIVHEEPRPLPDYRPAISGELERIVDKALTKDTGERYQHVDDLLADLRREKRETDSRRLLAGARPRVRGRRKRFPLLIPASALAVAVVLLLALQPWRLKLIPDQPAVAAENSLAVMFFDNIFDPGDSDRYGYMIASLLTTDLSQSEPLAVVSRQRLFDILKQIGHEDSQIIDRSIASQVARRANVKWILSGEILQIEPTWVITSEIVDAASGAILASQRATGDNGDDVFTMVDKLSTAIKRDLSAAIGTAAGHDEQDLEIAQVTTHSAEAYRHYLEGWDNYFKLYHLDAFASFKKAIALDSTFAMAHYGAALTGSMEERRHHIAKAMQYLDNAGAIDQLYIRSQHASLSGNQSDAIAELERIIARQPDEKLAHFMLGSIFQNARRDSEAVIELQRVIELDPFHKLSYNSLAYAYDRLGDFDRSIWAINQYISLAPDEANPYDTRGDLYAFNGRLDQAIDSYAKSVEIKPDFWASVFKLGAGHLLRGNQREGEKQFRRMTGADDPFVQVQGRLGLLMMPIYRGQFTTALRLLDEEQTAIGSEAAAEESDRHAAAMKEYDSTIHFIRGSIRFERGDIEGALAEVEEACRIRADGSHDQIIGLRDALVLLEARAGNLVEAERIASELRRDIEAKNENLLYSYWFASGQIELARGDTLEAVGLFEKAVADPLNEGFRMRYSLAEVYLEAGRRGEAVSTLEEAMPRYDSSRFFSPIATVKAHYLLGRAYEESGWAGKASEQYEEFLDHWQDADPGIEEVQDARQRLARLRS